MSYCRPKDIREWKKMQQIWKADILNEIKQNDDFWDKFFEYDFEENEEWSIKDFEQSPLCQILWGEIISNYLKEKFGGSYTYRINRYYLIVKNDNKSYRFLFDVMNNPKYINDSEGKLDNQCKCKFKYHLIGNFVPIPGNTYPKPSLQFIHKGYNEDWNKMLKYLKREWDNFKMDFPFCDYIAMTFQGYYFSGKEFNEISTVEDIKKLINDRGKSIQEKCKEIFNEENMQ